MPSIMEFKGEVPLIHERLRPPSVAQIAQNTKLERGIIEPFRKPKDITTVSGSAQTIYRHQGQWLEWDMDVHAAPGPVASDRLYVTGDGVPKLIVSGTTYDLAIPRPTGKLKAHLRSNYEYLVVDGKEIRLTNAKTATTSSGVEVLVEVKANVATVSLVHDGLTEAEAEALVDGLKYRNGHTIPVPSLKIVRIIKIKDDGGQTVGGDGELRGSDRRTLDDVGTTVSVAGTDLTYDFPTPDAQDSTDTSGQNDPPTISTTGLAPSFAALGSAVSLFSNTSINAVEGGQNIIKITVEVAGLTNGMVDQTTSEDLKYTYTYVTGFGEESEPADLSNRITWSPGQAVRLSDFIAPPSGRNITKIRIYRAQTSLGGDTDLYFVAEEDITPSLWDDDIDLVTPQEPIPSLDFNQPDDDLEGLTAMPNGMMAAFKGKNLYFCEPYQIHAWPDKYALRMDYEIMGLAAFGTTLAVMTKGQPYVVQGLHPDSMVSEKLELAYPCISKKSIVDMGYYAAYATNEGLVTIGSGGAQLVTEGLFTPRQWKKLNPGSFVCAMHQGRYIMSFTDTSLPETKQRCYIIDLTTGAAPSLVKTSWDMEAFYFDIGTGDLFFLRDGGEVQQFDHPLGLPANYKWRSSPVVFGGYVNFSTFMVEGERLNRHSKLSVRIYVDGRKRHTITKPNEPVRLMSGFRGRSWEVEIVGTMPVHKVSFADSPSNIGVDI